MGLFDFLKPISEEQRMKDQLLLEVIFKKSFKPFSKKRYFFLAH